MIKPFLVVAVTMLVSAAPAHAASAARFHVDWTEANANGSGESGLSPYIMVRERASGTMAQVECNARATPQCRYGFGSIPSTHPEADGAHAVSIVDDDPAAGRSFCATAQSGIASDAVSYTGRSIVTDLGGAQRSLTYAIDAGHKVAPLGSTPSAGWTADCQVASTAPPTPGIPSAADGPVRLELTWSGDPSPRFYAYDATHRALEAHCSGSTCLQNAYFESENTFPAIPSMHWTGTPGKLALVDEAAAQARALCFASVGFGMPAPTGVTATVFDPSGGSRQLTFTVANGQPLSAFGISPLGPKWADYCFYDWGRMVVADQKLKVSRAGTVNVKLGNAHSGFPTEQLTQPAPIALVLATYKTKHRRSVKLGTLNTQLLLDAGRTVKIKLTKAGLAAIGHRRGLAIGIQATERDPHGKKAPGNTEAKISGPSR
jgi:hypothetical protein